MAQQAQSGAGSSNLMIDHISDLIVEAARLREQAFEHAAAGDRSIAADLHEDAGSLASVAVSFRYDLADAYADSTDADNLIAALDDWTAILGHEPSEPLAAGERA